jgi:hypothetical protein
LARATKKPRKKKRSPIEINSSSNGSKLQAGSSKNDYEDEISLNSRDNVSQTHDPHVPVNWRCDKRAVVKREKAGSRTGICLVIIIGKASLYFGTLEEEFQWATFFFRGFLLRGPIRKSRTWRSAARVEVGR